MHLPYINNKKVYTIDLARRPRETTGLMIEATKYDNISINISAAYVRLGQIRFVKKKKKKPLIVFFS